MSDIDVKALREVLKQATPGPWRYGALEHGGRCVTDGRGYLFAQVDDDGNGRTIAALRNAAPALLDRIAELEAEAAKTDELLVSVVAKWEEMERCAYNICAHCKEPFERGEAMSLHAQECPRNPVVMLNVAQAERIAALEEGLREACELGLEAARAAHAFVDNRYEATSARLAGLRSLASPSGAPGEAGK